MVLIIYSILIGTFSGWVAGLIVKKEYLCLRNSILGIIGFWISIWLRFIDISYASAVICVLVTIPVTILLIWLKDKLIERYCKK